MDRPVLVGADAYRRLSPVVFGVLVALGSWDAPFIVAAALLLAGAAVGPFGSIRSGRCSRPAKSC